MFTKWKSLPAERRAAVPARAPAPRSELQHFPRLTGDHPTKWNFPDYLDNPNSRWLQCLKEMYSMPITFPASLAPEAGLLLHSFIRNFKPKTVIEVGSFLSISTHWIASALQANGEGGVVHCFDDFGPIHKGPWRDAEMLTGRLEWVQDRLTKSGLIEHVRFHPGNSSPNIRAAHDQLRAAGGVQFAYLDGDHTIPGVIADFQATEPVLATGGYVMLHDIYPEQCGGHDGPRHVLDHASSLGKGLYEHCELYSAPLNYGLALLRRTA
jgi:cephalosporin hydroxylase